MSRAIDLPPPCVGVCTLDSATGYCLGCLRTAGEIAAWRELDFEQRLALLGRLCARRRGAANAPAAA